MMDVGWILFLTRSFARFSSSPARMTTDVVPSPTSRSWSSASSTRICRSRRHGAREEDAEGGAREAGEGPGQIGSRYEKKMSLPRRPRRRSGERAEG